MWVNLGLFLLTWESIAVLVMVPVRFAMPAVSTGDLTLTVGAMMAPVGYLVMRVIDRRWLGDAQFQEPTDHDGYADRDVVDMWSAAEEDTVMTETDGALGIR